MRVLVVEDEPRIAAFIRNGLRAEGWSALVAGDAETAIAQAREEQIDLVLLDLLLPDGSGMDVLRAVRTHDPGLPVLVLTARDDVASKVKHLDGGADDYMTKPFSFEELLARMRALVRREQATGAELRAGRLVLDLRTREARSDRGATELTVREAALLECFIRQPNQVLSRSQILSAAWPDDALTESNVVDVFVRYLRAKVPWPGDVNLETVRGTGYRLTAP